MCRGGGLALDGLVERPAWCVRTVRTVRVRRLRRRMELYPVWVTGSRGISRRHTCLRSPKSRGKSFLDVAWFLVLAGMAKGQPVARINIITWIVLGSIGGQCTAILPTVDRQSSSSALPDDWRYPPPLHPLRQQYSMRRTADSYSANGRSQATKGLHHLPKVGSAVEDDDPCTYVEDIRNRRLR